MELMSETTSGRVNDFLLLFRKSIESNERVKEQNKKGGEQINLLLCETRHVCATKTVTIIEIRE